MMESNANQNRPRVMSGVSGDQNPTDNGEKGPLTKREFDPIMAFAAWCRENCGKPGASHDGRLCGEQNDDMTTFCGRHLGMIL